MNTTTDRSKAEWRIVYDASWGTPLPYNLQYSIDDGRTWERWSVYETLWGAKIGRWFAKREAKPIGGVMVVD